VTTIRSARSRLLRRGRRVWDRERTQLALELGGIEASASGEPIAGAELEEALARPVRQDADDVAKVGLRIEAVEPSRSDQGHEVAGGLGMIVAADEHPCFSPDGDATELALGGVVVELEPTVVVEPGERGALAARIAERRAEQAALIANALVLGLCPREERVGVRAQMDLAERPRRRGSPWPCTRRTRDRRR